MALVNFRIALFLCSKHASLYQPTRSCVQYGRRVSEERQSRKVKERKVLRQRRIGYPHHPRVQPTVQSWALSVIFEFFQ